MPVCPCDKLARKETCLGCWRGLASPVALAPGGAPPGANATGLAWDNRPAPTGELVDALAHDLGEAAHVLKETGILRGQQSLWPIRQRFLGTAMDLDMD